MFLPVVNVKELILQLLILQLKLQVRMQRLSSLLIASLSYHLLAKPDVLALAQSVTENDKAAYCSQSRFMHWGRTHAHFLGVSIGIVWSAWYVGAKYQRVHTERDLLKKDINHQREMFNRERKMFEARIEAIRADEAQQKVRAIRQCYEKFLKLGYTAEYKALQDRESWAREGK